MKLAYAEVRKNAQEVAFAEVRFNGETPDEPDFIVTVTMDPAIEVVAQQHLCPGDPTSHCGDLHQITHVSLDQLSDGDMIVGIEVSSYAYDTNGYAFEAKMGHCSLFGPYSAGGNLAGPIASVTVYHANRQYWDGHGWIADL